MNKYIYPDHSFLSLFLSNNFDKTAEISYLTLVFTVLLFLNCSNLIRLAFYRNMTANISSYSFEIVDK